MTTNASAGDSGAAAECAAAAARARMVAEQIAARGVREPRVLAALRRVPRHRFVPRAWRGRAHGDHPVPLGNGQTVSQPFIVAFAVEALELPPGARVLEVGTGSGYQAAVLAEAGFAVWSIEILPELAADAAVRLRELGYGAVRLRAGDGGLGWPEAAPFDGIVVAAAAREIPTALCGQLGPLGRLVIPVGGTHQALWRVARTPEGFARERLLDVHFVPLTGAAA